MRIVQLTSGAGWSGGVKQVWHLSAGLRERGHEVILVCEEGSALEAESRAVGLKVVGLPMRASVDFGLMLRLRRLVKERGVQIIDVHRARPHGAAMALRALTGGPVLVATRRVSFGIGALSARFKWNRFADGIVAVSGAVRDILVRQGIPPAKIKVIYGGVDTRRFRPGLDPDPVRRELRLPEGVPLAALVANYIPWKGQAWFLGLLPEIIRETGPLKVILAGKKTDAPEVRELVRRLGLEETVILAGFRRDVESILAASDLLVCPSLDGEGLTGVLREAMAMKVPVVSTAVGGNGELVIKGRTGRLIPPGDGEAMRAACVSTLRSRPESLRMAEEGYRMVMERFSIPRMVRETEDYYRELLERRGR